MRFAGVPSAVASGSAVSSVSAASAVPPATLNVSTVPASFAGSRFVRLITS